MPTQRRRATRRTPVTSRQRLAGAPTPKTFALHWGSGVIEEEVAIATPYHRPTIQLLKFTDGETAGSYEIRFCHYDLRGRFQRSALIVDEGELRRLGEALRKAPKLRRLLAPLVR